MADPNQTVSAYLGSYHKLPGEALVNNACAKKVRAGSGFSKIAYLEPNLSWVNVQQRCYHCDLVKNLKGAGIVTMGDLDDYIASH